MFQDNDLSAAFTNQSTLSIEALVLGEFNLNDLDNIAKIGNYKYRTYGASPIALATSYDPLDVADLYSDTDISYEEYSGTDDTNNFIAQDKSPEYLYSLGDCFLQFRPRSGINKARFIKSKFIDNIRSGERPRYYMPSRSDYFKYWSSYRKDGTKERGISAPIQTYQNYYTIDDAAPFVVYNDAVPANRIVVKMQTNVGSVDRGVVRTSRDKYINDPLYGYENATVPRHWKIQVLDSNNNWIDAATFTPSSTRSDASPIVPKDGTVELFYGIKVPAGYIDTFEFKGYTSLSLIPTTGNLVGDAYIYGANASAEGTLVVWSGSAWVTESLDYGWSLLEDLHLKKNGNCSEIVDPLYFTSGSATIFREFDLINGIRVAVETMNSPESCFDLIEISPRLSVDFSDATTDFSISKSISGGDNGLPVGSLTTSNGTINLSNHNNAFNEANVFDGINGSIIANYLNSNIKFVFYETLLNINGANKYVPLKTMYSDRFTSVANGMDDVTIPLRDLFFRLETTNAPSLLYTDTTLTYAVANLLDYIGFSNYVFKTVDSYIEPILPYFFVEKDVSVAEILQRIAVATQAAMFFDEYNNFVVMTKEYLLANESDRSADLVLSGNESPIANIESIQPEEAIVLNDGEIAYTIRYVQREVSTVGSSLKLDNEKVYRYKPVLLWEVAANTETKTVNENTKEASGFALGAIALNTDLTASVPYVVNNQIINNVMDFGESIYWLPRFQGYLYANGEIVRFDAVEYAIPGNTAGSPVEWITSNQEYQHYFAKLPFNGKIYPTGRVRIYTEPFYEVSGSATYIKNGAVKSHGRGQFDTPIAYHPAGLPPYWSDNANTYGTNMYSENIFTTTPTEDLTKPTLSGTTRVETSTTNTLARKSLRNGIIKNFLSSKVYSDGYVNNLSTTDAGTIQSSALVFRGPKPSPDIPNPRDLVSYIYKDLSANAAFKHFGTRMRIIGKSDQNFGQIPNGSGNYFTLPALTVDDVISVNGGSGGIAVMVDPNNGSGYYFEIAALSGSNIDSYMGLTNPVDGETEIAVHNIFFYKINAQTKSGDGVNAKAVPEKLWGGLADIIVDAGLFVGQDRIAVGQKTSVYDLSVEYEVVKNGAINFYLYINNTLVKVVKDTNPLPIKTAAALFVRSASECMFENFYAIEDIVSRGESYPLVETGNVFDKTSVTTNEFMDKFAMSGIVQSSYLTSISPSNPLKMRLYFEEFGTIMRECAYFNIQYDQAFPAFFSRIAKTFSKDRTYAVSGYYGGAYEAEFLIFNSADKAIVLDESTGSYLRILGVTFTQNTTQSMSVDDYYNKISNASDPQYENNVLLSPEYAKRDYNKIRASRSKYGNRQFTLDSMYIQSESQARELMGWLINKTLKPRKDLSISTFPMPHLQLGDIVTIEYTTSDNIEYIDPSSRFVVKEISYARSNGNINQTLRVVEI